jgi:hypothetical protein
MDSGELSQLRADILALLPDICDIVSVTRTPDGFGGWAETLSVSSTIACRMDHKTGREMLGDGSVRTYQYNLLTLPHTANISTANRVVYEGNLYNVTSVSEGSNLAVMRVGVERVGPAVASGFEPSAGSAMGVLGLTYSG